MFLDRSLHLMPSGKPEKNIYDVRCRVVNYTYSTKQNKNDDLNMKFGIE